MWNIYLTRLTMSYNGFKTNDMFGPKPVEVGKEYDVQITELSRKGDGIARIQRFVIFVRKERAAKTQRKKNIRFEIDLQQQRLSMILKVVRVRVRLRTHQQVLMPKQKLVRNSRPVADTF